MALSNADYDAIMRIYNDRQLNNLRDLDERRKEAFERFPRLREIAEETASLSVQKAKALLGEAGVQDFNLDERLLDLAEERSVLLTAGGYPEDYLEMHYTCPVCRDTGFVDGKKCSCFLQEEIRYLYSGSNDREILERENFDHFNLDYYSDDVRDGNGISPREAAEAAYGEARQFLANFDREPENLLIYGDTGTGKSFLSHCIARELIRMGKSVLYLTAYDLFERLADRTFRRDEEDGRSDRIFDADLLIIDDLGTEMANAFVTSQFFLCVNERFLKNKSTIISTNLRLADLQERYSERTSSRIISSYRLIPLYGSDIRIQKQMRGGH